jgi:hypothetical protein
MRVVTTVVHEETYTFTERWFACCSAKIAAMQEQNVCDRAAGRPVTYTPEQFESAPDKFSLGHNAVITHLSENY